MFASVTEHLPRAYSGAARYIVVAQKLSRGSKAQPVSSPLMMTLQLQWHHLHTQNATRLLWISFAQRTTLLQMANPYVHLMSLHLSASYTPPRLARRDCPAAHLSPCLPCGEPGWPLAALWRSSPRRCPQCQISTTTYPNLAILV